MWEALVDLVPAAAEEAATDLDLEADAAAADLDTEATTDLDLEADPAAPDDAAAADDPPAAADDPAAADEPPAATDDPATRDPEIDSVLEKDCPGAGTMYM
jgi:hypothetical protein